MEKAKVFFTMIGNKIKDFFICLWDKVKYGFWIAVWYSAFGLGITVSWLLSRIGKTMQKVNAWFYLIVNWITKWPSRLAALMIYVSFPIINWAEVQFQKAYTMNRNPNKKYPFEFFVKTRRGP